MQEAKGPLRSECIRVTYKISDIRAETFVHGAESELYPILGPEDPDFVSSIFEPMKDAFHVKAPEDVSKWRTEVRGCPENCRCVTSTDKRDAIRSRERISLSANYTFPDGAVGRINGSYQLEIIRTQGTCISAPKNIQALRLLLQGWLMDKPSNTPKRNVDEQ